MNCDNDTKRDVLLLAAGALPAGRALELERHIAACPACAALRLAVLGQQKALEAAGAPLLAAGPGFAASVAAAAAGEPGGGRLTASGLVLAGVFALLMIFGLPRESRFAAPSGASITPGFINPFGASVPGRVSETDFLNRLSVREAKEPGNGPAPVNLKEGS